MSSSDSNGANVGYRDRPSRPLTHTEARIARLVAVGRTNQEVAAALHLSPKTVEWNLTKIYRALQVRSRTELASKLARRGGLA
jgi:DNA-binding CsgD family transcriptional regulator